MRSRPFEAAFLCGAVLATIACVAIFSTLESSKPGAFFCLLAGGAWGYGYRSARASDYVPSEVARSRFQRGA